MLSYAKAVAAIEELVCIPKLEPVPLSAALGMVIAEDIRLGNHQPPFDRATMDGYALMLDGDSASFHIMGSIVAGGSFAGTLKPGQGVRIMTGAPCPKDTTVVPLEATDRGEQQVKVTDRSCLVPGNNIAREGEDGRAGEIIVGAGTFMTPTTIAAAAMCGISEVTVLWPPRMAIITTGDEVGGSGDGAIVNSNGPFLSAFAHAVGVEATRIHVTDNKEQLLDAFHAAMLDADLIVSTGGVSAGDKDLVVECAKKVGFGTVFHNVAMQPGKPVYLGRYSAKDSTARKTKSSEVRAQFFIGLPGNPVSVVATAHVFLLPLIGQLLGGWRREWLELPITMPWKHSGQRHLFLPGRLIKGGIEPVRWNGSGDLIAAATGDGLIDIPPSSSFKTGDHVRFLPYIGYEPGGRARMPARGER
jgi:molybdopterin molybdotransferase